MNAKKFLSAITSAAVGLSMLLGTGVTQAFASAIDTDAFTPVRHSNQTVTTTISGDSAVTTTTATTTGIYTTTTAVTAIDYNGIGYPYSGEKVVSINVVDEATGYSIYGDVDVTARLLTSEDINNGNKGVDIASWNLDEENIQLYALTVPYTVEYEGQMLFIGVYIDNYTDIAYNDIQETLFVFEPLCDDASFEYNVPLDKSYVTTLAPLDYCECCGKDLELGEGIRSPLGLYICQECSDAGLGGTTTAPATTTTTNHGEGTGTTTTSTTTTTVNSSPYLRPCDGCGVAYYTDKMHKTNNGYYYCVDCVEAGLVTTTTTTTTTVTTLNTHTTPAMKQCECCGDYIFEYQGTYSPLGLFICPDCVKAGAGGTTVPVTGTTTSNEMVYYVSVDSSNAKTVYNVGERLSLSGVKVSGSCSDGELCGDIFGQELLSLLDSGTVSVDTSEFNSNSAGVYRIYVTFGTAVDYYEVYVVDGTGTTTTTTATTTPISTTDGIYTTTTTTVTTTTTIHYDYRTELEYDSSEMKIGETRAIYFYNAYSGVGTDPFIGEVSDNISYAYVEGTNVIYITALAAGEAKLYIREGTCAFGAYVNITVTESTSDSIPYVYGDADKDGQVKMNDVIMVLCYSANPTKFPLNEDVKQYCDVYQTGDGVDISDALEMQKYVAQVITEFSVEK